MSNLLLWAGPDAGFDAAVSPPLHPKVCWLPIFQNVEILMPQTFFHEKLESASIDPIMYWSFLVYEGNQENEFGYRDEIKTMLLNILNQSQTWKENLCKWNDPYRPFIIISQRKYVSFWRALGDSSNFRERTWNLFTDDFYPPWRWSTDLMVTHSLSHHWSYLSHFLPIKWSNHLILRYFLCLSLSVFVFVFLYRKMCVTSCNWKLVP